MARKQARAGCPEEGDQRGWANIEGILEKGVVRRA